MSEQSPVPESGAPQSEQPEDPFAGFQSESYAGGARTDEEAATEERSATGDTSAGELAEEEVAEGEGTPEPAVPPKKKPQTAQERIDELTRARREAERRAEAAERRAEAAERAKPAEEKPAEPAAEVPQGPPQPDDFEFGELDSAYIAATVKYHTDQRIAEFTEQQARAQRQAAVQTKFTQTVERGRGKYDDFEEKVVQGAQDGAWPLSETLGSLLVESDVGEDIAYHLATNPDEAASIYAKAPVEQARYFGRLEAKFSAARAAATGGNEPAVTPATTRAPKAPAPVVPARGAGGTFTATASSDDFAAFERAAQQNN